MTSPSPIAIAALIVAAGRGTRAGDIGAPPKQYRPLAGQPVLRRAIAPFSASARIDLIAVVIDPRDHPLYESASAGLPGLGAAVPGGESRQDSVRRGLEALADTAPEIVLIHDAARPFVSEALIGRMIDAARRHGAAAPALPVPDSLARAGAGGIRAGAVDRDGLHAVQTPQAFRFADILAAHRRAWQEGCRDFTDDAAVAAHAGLDVRLVPGEAGNLKLTVADDFAEAEMRLAARLLLTQGDVRTGTGFDVHAFGPGDHIVLGGVRVPHERGLLGHSDADVALHALTDAILGALGDGDIGQHFPPSDMRWQGADSALFLADAAARVRARGGTIAHLDLTVIGEAPKVGPHRAAIVTRIAAIVGIEPARVGVKATTTERLGFAGRREGLAALASATIRLPFTLPPEADR